MIIKVGARTSPLSLKQVDEVLAEIRVPHPQITFECQFAKTQGDLDLLSSLKPLEKTNFFTDVIDQMLIDGLCDIAIHSAKDLPEPLDHRLEIIAITQGVDPSDVIVLREGESLPKDGRIGTSSQRREEQLKELGADLRPVDIRGPIERRLELLDNGEVDGVIMAKAALIRLGLLQRHTLPLGGEPAPLQGQLAILARKGDREMETLFAPLDSRERV